MYISRLAFGTSLSISRGVWETILIKFCLRPYVGSITIFTHSCKNPVGRFDLLSVTKNSLNISLIINPFSLGNSSIMASWSVVCSSFSSFSGLSVVSAYFSSLITSSSSWVNCFFFCFNVTIFDFYLFSFCSRISLLSLLLSNIWEISFWI